MKSTVITPARERAAARLLAKLPCTAAALTPTERRELTRLERAGRIHYSDDLWQRAKAPDFDTRDREGRDADNPLKQVCEGCGEPVHDGPCDGDLQEDYPGQRITGPEPVAPFLVKIVPNDRGNPPGKLADIELLFHPSMPLLAGLKLIGFAVWERRGSGGRNVTFPARQYSVNGERRSFALLRPQVDATATDRLRDVILEAYAKWEAGL